MSNIELDRKEIYRYMGIRGGRTDDRIDRMIDRAIAVVMEASSVKRVYKPLSFYLEDHGVCVFNKSLTSQSLRTYFQDCKQALVLAVTLGTSVDRVLTKDSLLTPSLAVAEQAVATALLEHYSDQFCKELEQPFLKQGLRCKPRFSPGYGDCRLDSQRELLDYLDAQKRIGLTLTDSLMMSPMKSISAFVGITSTPTVCQRSGCSLCDNLECQFRKEESVL